jgi:ribosomal protein S18 acetylase RimI-like enzyme
MSANQPTTPPGAPIVSYRLTEERDVPDILEMYTLLNKHFYATGYRLPSPDNVAEIWWDTFKRTLGRFSNSWVAEVDDLLAGFITCRIKHVPAYMGGVLVGELSDMWIIPQARRLHIGDHLSRQALEWLREQGVHSVEIQVLTGNEASWNLYQRMGFQLEFRVARLLWDEYQPEP